MIKRNLLAVVIPALLLLAAGSVNATEIYSDHSNKLDLHLKVASERYWKTNTNSTLNNRDGTYAQIGFRGKTKISDTLTGYGRWDYRAPANTAEGRQFGNTCLAYAGLNFSDTHSLDYGRNYGILHDVESWTAPSFSEDTWAGRPDVFMNNRTVGVLTYRNNDFFGLVDGLRFGAQYQGKNEGNRNSVHGHNENGFGVSLGYDYGNFGVVGAYSKSDRSLQHVAVLSPDYKHWEQILYNNGKSPEAWAVGIKYDTDNIYLATIYSETRNMAYYGSARRAIDKTQNFEAVAQYQFDFGLRPSVSYVKSHGNGLSYGTNGTNSYKSANLVEQVTLGASYSFSKDFSMYGNYCINMLDNNAYIQTNSIHGIDNQAMLGIAYQF